MDNIPNHVAIILDGNRRWAKKHMKNPIDGHKKGLDNLVNLVEHIFRRGVNFLSVYAFSKENFKRSKKEVDYIMKMFLDNVDRLSKILMDNNIRIVFSGRKENLSTDVINKIEYLENTTNENSERVFNVCFNYSSQAEIVDATKRIIDDKIESSQINIEMFNSYLYKQLPPVDLMIRPGGEFRLSNFLLWQIAYAELYFTDVLFPDFNEMEFDKAIVEFSKRQRRFGGDMK